MSFLKFLELSHAILLEEERENKLDFRYQTMNYFNKEKLQRYQFALASSN